MTNGDDIQDLEVKPEYNIPYLEAIVSLVDRLDDESKKFYPTKIYEELRNYLVLNKGSEKLDVLLKEIIIKGANSKPRILFKEMKELGRLHYDEFQNIKDEDREIELVKQFHISCRNVDDRVEYVKYMLEDKQLMQKSEEIHDLMNQILIDIETLQNLTHETAAAIIKSKNVSKIERRMNQMQNDLIRMIDGMNQNQPK